MSENRRGKGQNPDRRDAGQQINTKGRRGLLEDLGERARHPEDVRVPTLRQESVVVEVGVGEPMSACGGCNTNQPDVYPFRVGSTADDAQPVDLCRPCSEKKYVRAGVGRGFIGPVRTGKIDERI